MRRHFIADAPDCRSDVAADTGIDMQPDAFLKRHRAGRPLDNVVDLEQGY